MTLRGVETDEIADRLDAARKLQKKRQLVEALADPRLARYRDDPVGFVHTVLEERLWGKEREIMESVRDHRQTFVFSCHEAGKSYTASRVVCWWLACNPPGEAFAVTTAPTFPQVRAILWREINRAHRKGKLPGYMNQTEWWLRGEMVGFGRKPAVASEEIGSSAFQGIHARRVLVVIDEAAGVPEGLFDAAYGLIGNEDSRLLAIGHPDDPLSAFARKSSQGNRISISAFETPNFTGGEGLSEAVLSELVSPVWVEERRADWGEDSPLYRSRVDGVFPDSSDDSLIPLRWVQAAIDQDIPDPQGKPVLAIDVARFGRDRTVFGVYTEGRFRIVEVKGKNTLTEATGLAVLWADKLGVSEVRVDEVGVGAGVVDRLTEIAEQDRKPWRVLGLSAGEAAIDATRFINARAEWWWHLRELFENGLIDLDDDPQLAGELTGMRYSFDSKGRIRVESKDDMKARGMRSPDKADTLMLAAAQVKRRLIGPLGV